MTRIAIVGNGPVSLADQDRIVDTDLIYRFNRVPAANRARSAATTHLVLANSTKQVGTYLRDGAYRDDPCFAAARTIVAPFDPSIIAALMRKPNLLSRLKGRRADWTPALRAAARQTDKSVEIWPPQLYRDACRILNIDPAPRDLFPSTGFLAILHARQSHEKPVIDLFGFGFQGWKRHDWTAEARIVRAWSAQGDLTLHPPAG